MNGTTAEPWLKTIKTPNKAKIIMIGNNQYFFSLLKIPKILLKILSLNSRLSLFEVSCLLF